MSVPTLILGYGNPLRGDDGLGWRIAEDLQRELTDPNIEVLIRHQLTPELAEDISRVEKVIFIDAGSEGKPGTCRVSEVCPLDSAHAFTHSQTPDGLLLSAEILFGRRPEKAYLVSVAAESFEYVEELSATALAAIPRAMEEVKRLLNQ